MAIQTFSSAGVRKTITNLGEPQQIRELNRQMDWIWRQLLGKLDAKAFSTDGLKQLIESTQNALTEDLSDEDVGAAAFLDALWKFVLDNIVKTVFEMAALKTMLSSAFELDDADERIKITNLEVTEDNIRNATQGIRDDLEAVSQKADDALDAIDNLTVTNDMISQEVWDTIQQMIDAPGS